MAGLPSAGFRYLPDDEPSWGRAWGIEGAGEMSRCAPVPYVTSKAEECLCEQ